MHEPRPVCSRCRRPCSVCYCAALSRLETATRVVILQHPRERDMPIGTARMASLCLPQATLHVGVRWDAHPALAAALADPARPPILLYPAPGARDILRDPPRAPITLIVVDGTWSQARTVVRDNPVLQALPRYAFATPEPSHYRIRREPRAEYVSTIEALMHVLGVLEGDPGRFRALLDPLYAMVDAQLARRATAAPRPTRVRYRRHRLPRALDWGLPDALTARFADLVYVAAEANAWPYSAGRPAHVDELVHWAALRPSTGEVFTRVAAPERELSPSTTFHSELAEDRLRAGGTCVELVEAFDRFVRPTDAIAAWGTYAFGLYGGVLPSERIDLRAVAKRLEARRIGSLEDYAGEAPPAVADGRAGRRLAMIARIVEGWRARAGLA